MTVTKLPFEWPHPADLTQGDEIALTPTAIETVVALMARAIIAAVRGAQETEEVDDER